MNTHTTRNAQAGPLIRRAPRLAVAALASGGIGAGVLASQAVAQPAAPPEASPIVVIVRVPKPWYAPRLLVASKMRATVPDYDRLPGLLFKAYSFERASSDFGGLYYWADRARAEAWFNPAWFERVRTERGVEGSVRFFDAPVSIDNTAGGTPLALASNSVGTLVEIPVPGGMSRERLVAAFHAAVPTYRQVPGLLRKHFTLSSSGHSFGGVYLWKDEASATAWFNAAWHGRVVATYGQDAKIEWFDTPILLPTRAAGAPLAPTATAPAPAP